MTLFQFAEGLPDRQAAEAVRGRIDWKYALALPLADPGFDSTVLREFRSRSAAVPSNRPSSSKPVANASSARLVLIPQLPVH